MKPKNWIIPLLLRFYPEGWRSEYGPELHDTLLARPLNPTILLDVIANGICQRIRTADLATLVGLAMMIVVAARVLSHSGEYPLVERSGKLLPTAIVPLFESGLYVLLLFGCGFWTAFRENVKISRAGVAAMKLTFIAGLPIMVVGVLAMFGVVRAEVWIANGKGISPLAALMAPIFELPKSWVWGAAGGRVGSAISRRLSKTVR